MNIEDVIFTMILGAIIGYSISSILHDEFKVIKEFIKCKINRKNKILRRGFIKGHFYNSNMIVEIEELERLVDMSKIKIISIISEFEDDAKRFKDRYNNNWYKTNSIQFDTQLKDKLDSLLN